MTQLQPTNGSMYVDDNVAIDTLLSSIGCRLWTRCRNVTCQPQNGMYRVFDVRVVITKELTYQVHI